MTGSFISDLSHSENEKSESQSSINERKAHIGLTRGIACGTEILNHKIEPSTTKINAKSLQKGQLCHASQHARGGAKGKSSSRPAASLTPHFGTGVPGEISYANGEEFGRKRCTGIAAREVILVNIEY